MSCLRFRRIGVTRTLSLGRAHERESALAACAEARALPGSVAGLLVFALACSGSSSSAAGNEGGGAGVAQAGAPASAGSSGNPSGGAGTGPAGAANAGDAGAAGAGTSGVGTSGAGGEAGTSGSGGTGGSSGSSGFAGAGGSSGSSGSLAADAAFCKAELTSAATHYAGFRAAYTDPMRIPRSAKAGSVRLVAPSDWTSGFVAGSFWQLYEHTGDAAFRSAAESWTQALQSQSLRTDTHDVGFVIQNTFGTGYRLTQNAAYRSVVLRAAESLMSRFNSNVGAIRSWSFGSWSHPVIIDNMMNLELLFNAAELGGSSMFASTAVTHALTTRANHFRPDGSSYHLVDYNPSTGAVVRKQTNQGLNDASAWARGQAWGLYGYTLVYRATRDARFLEQAQRIADFYTRSERMPADCVPYFDFDASILPAVPDHRDASAGAIAASALFELAGFAPPEAAARYRSFALCAVRSLSSSAYRAALGANSHFLLMHSVGNYPIDDEIDVAMNYADYYYIEGLSRCGALE